MPVRFSKGLLGRLDFARATRDERAQPLDSLPSRTVERAIVGHEDEFARLVEARCSAGLDLELPETVWLPKSGNVGRYRPITALSFTDRVILRALSHELREDLPEFDRSPQAQLDFQREALKPATSHVVVADVASFYFFVDHQTLASRIVDVTARADTAEMVRTMLGTLSGRGYGLPQNFGPSEAFSEAVIAPVERRMLRAGVTAYRANDDFRLCAETWGDALRALERLQEEISAVGLDLNGDKSWILKRETYKRHLNLVNEYIEDALQEAAASTRVSPPITYVDVNPYTGEPVDEPDDDADEDDYDDDDDDDREDEETSSPETVRFLHHVFSRAFERRTGGDKLSGFEQGANRRVLTMAVGALARERADVAVSDFGSLVAIEPLFARQYASYVRSVRPEGGEASGWLWETLRRFDGHAPYWAQAWLANVMIDRAVGMTQETHNWLDGLLSSSAPGSLRMRAAIALAIRGEVSPLAIAQLVDGLQPDAKPDAVVAMAIAGADEKLIGSVVGSDRLLRWVHEFAVAHISDLDALF